MDFSKGTPCQFFFWIAAIFALFWRATPPKKGEERYFSSTNFNFKLTCQKWTFLRGPHVNFFFGLQLFWHFFGAQPPIKGEEIDFSRGIHAIFLGCSYFDDYNIT